MTQASCHSRGSNNNASPSSTIWQSQSVSLSAFHRWRNWGTELQWLVQDHFSRSVAETRTQVILTQHGSSSLTSSHSTLSHANCFHCLLGVDTALLTTVLQLSLQIGQSHNLLARVNSYAEGQILSWRSSTDLPGLKLIYTGSQSQASSVAVNPRCAIFPAFWASASNLVVCPWVAFVPNLCN